MTDSPTTTVVTPSAKEWFRLARPFAIVGIIVAAVLSILVIFGYSASDGKPLSPINPTANGAQALARVLEREGITVQYTTDVDEAHRLSQQPDSTLLVVRSGAAHGPMPDSLAHVKNLVLADTSTFRGTILPGLSAGYRGVVPQNRTSAAVTSACQSPTAKRAQTITSGPQVLTIEGSHWTGCFQVAPSSFLFAETSSERGYRAVISNPEILQNASITKNGNASLAMGVLGRTRTLVWYVGDATDSANEQPQVPAAPFPPWLFLVVISCFLTSLTFGVSKGRRLGRLVAEDFVTPVPAAETIVGQGRLMGTHDTRDFAARTLKRDAADRIARRLGVPTSPNSHALKDALLGAGISPARTDTLLWGPTPTTDSDLIDLAHQLKQLEKDLHVRQ